MKKLLVALLAVGTAVLSSAASPRLVKLWETELLLKVPESVLVDTRRDVLYVSNIDGQPWEDDKQGSIGKVGLDGQIIAVNWVAGLSAPKGMALYGNLLYVGDINRLVVIDVEKGEIVETITIPEAHGLNDVTVSDRGVVYVSDSRDKKIYLVSGGKATVVIEGLAAPNGVHAREGELYFMDNGTIFRLGRKGEKISVNVGMAGNGDGLEGVGGGEFLVSYWQGVIDYAKADGTRETLLDTSGEKISAADIGYDVRHRVVYVPTFFKNSIVAYQLK